ncbi:hypothetical protein Shyd_19100 [Streptomyces hydrogenans]|uniref:Uncharacterized protein n=1 Tax=Streptomyces hydrogenans TaxID=1873719 RepID=A0ABQ3P691_9ACTN|nr:hypothetical protein Shyd_19100 [Streptomyces hydrogenans]
MAPGVDGAVAVRGDREVPYDAVGFEPDALGRGGHDADVPSSGPPRAERVRLEADGVVRDFAVAAYGDGTVHAGRHRLTPRPRFTDPRERTLPGPCSRPCPAPSSGSRTASPSATGSRPGSRCSGWRR